MNREAFERTLGLLNASGIAVENSRYDRPAMGSWLISAVVGRARLRAVCDGRDDLLMLQRFFPGRTQHEAWTAIWVAQSQAERRVIGAVGFRIVLLL